MPQNLKPLTAIRFLAAMWVVTYDDWPDLGIAVPGVVSKGYLGVELFFVLSGFILCHVYLARFGDGRFSYANFLWARLARIYPVHLATLLGLGALAIGAGALGLKMSGKLLVWSSLPAQLSLTQGWGLAPAGGWNHPSWSLSAEWFAYLSFPAFAWAALRMRGRAMLSAVAAASVLMAAQWAFGRLAGYPLSSATLAWAPVRIAPCFLLGCATYVLWSERPVTRPASAFMVTAVSVALIALVSGLGLQDAAVIVLFAPLLYGLASLSSGGGRLLTARPWIYLGEISFAVYMVAFPWRLVFAKLVQRMGAGGDDLPLWIWGIELAGVIPIAILLHHLVERPAREAMRSHAPPWRSLALRLKGREAAFATARR